MLKGFKQFILRGNVVDLAVGVVIGASFQGVVSSLVKDFISPLIGLIGGKSNFSSLAITVSQTKFLIGDFLNELISFLLIAVVVYFFVVLPVNKLMARMIIDKPATPNTKKCPECLSTIPTAAKRCAFCTAVLKKGK